MSYHIGVDLGGTKIRVALAQAGGRVVAVHSFPTGAQYGAETVLFTLQAGVHELLKDRCTLDKVSGLGVCAAGFYDSGSELMVKSPNLPGWEGFPLKQKLAELFGLPVIVENDASAAAYGEYCFGAAQGQENTLLLTLGTGIGGGLVLRGKLYRGNRGFAGEIGHIPMLPDGPRCGCGRYGCLEALASGTAIGREGRNLLAGNDPTLLREMVSVAAELRAEHVFKAAALGDKAAAEIIEYASFFLGRALAMAVTILNPGIVVLSGGIAARGEEIIAPVRRHFHAAVLDLLVTDLQIMAGQLGADSGIRGILQLVEEHLAEGGR